MPVVSNVTGDVAEQQVEEVEMESLESLIPPDPLEEEDEGREFAKERMARRRVILFISNLGSLTP